MQVQLILPDDIAQSLASKWGNLERKLLEMIVIEAYRDGSISVGKLRELIGLATRLEADNWLKSRGIDLHYNETDFKSDRQTHNHLKQQGSLNVS
jgi:predicted HTH domain antitoxin